MKPTQAQATILHAVLSVAVATIIGASTAATQFYFNHGQDLWLALAFFGGSLPTMFATLRYAVWHAIQTSPALPQAETDMKNEILDFLSKDFGGFINQHMGFLGDRLQAIEASIANHTHTPLPPAPAPSSVPQLSFPSQPSVPFQVTSGSTTASAPQPQAQLLNTLPTLAAVPKQ